MMPMLETRSSLILRVRDPADATSWGEFVALYEPLLHRYVRGMGVPDQEAADAVQELFTVLLQALPRFELDRERGRFRTWLWRVARNALVDWARRRQRRAAAEEVWRQELLARSAAEPDAEWLRAHRQRVLAVALERVRERAEPRTWACFERHLLHGRPSAQVGGELGLTANAVLVNASRVLQRVRAQCADYLEDLGDAD
jgi:RNA polymerase sigma-70 factor (ECF subfamily)